MSVIFNGEGLAERIGIGKLEGLLDGYAGGVHFKGLLRL